MSIFHGVELLEIINQTAKIKEFPSNILFEALELGLVEAYKKKYGIDKNIKVEINKKTGLISAYWIRQVSEFVQDVNQIDFFTASKINKDIIIGENIQESLPSLDSSSKVFSIVKKVLSDKVNEAERSKEYEDFKSRVGDIVFGVIKYIDQKGNCTLSLSGGGLGFISNKDLLPTDRYRISDRVRSYIYQVSRKDRGCQILLSRKHDGMLSKLFELEVPQIYDKIVVIKSIARDPGFKSLVSVHSIDGVINPRSVCIGARGNRIKNITEELNGEKIDVVTWDSDVKQFILNAFRSDKIYNVIVHNDIQLAEVIILDGALGLLIGREGQNVRLISTLIGMQIKVISKELYDEKIKKRLQKSIQELADFLDIDYVHAKTLAESGYDSLQSVKYALANDLDEFKKVFYDVKVENTQGDDFVNFIAKKAENINKKVEAKQNEVANKYHLDKSLLILFNKEFDWNTVFSLAPNLSDNGIKAIEDLDYITASELSNISSEDLDIIKINKILHYAREYSTDDSTDILNPSEDHDYVLENIEASVGEAIQKSISEEDSTNDDVIINDEISQNKNHDDQINLSGISDNEEQIKLHNTQKSSHITGNKKDYEDEDDDVKKKSSIKRQQERKTNKSKFTFVEEDEFVKQPSVSKILRARAKSHANMQHDGSKNKIYREVAIKSSMTVEEISHAMSEKVTSVMKELKQMGLDVKSDSVLDIDTIEVLVISFGHTAKVIQSYDSVEKIFDQLCSVEPKESRYPIVAVLGDTKHGKTMLIRKLCDNDCREIPITQKINAYELHTNDNKHITFIDTPGNTIFKDSHKLVAECTDIILVVLDACTGISQQTIEIFQLAKAIKSPLIVAINKIDKCSEDDIKNIKTAMLEHSIVPEEFGGDVIVNNVSAKEGTNLNSLLESINLVSEVEDLKANVTSSACGIILDSSIDKDKRVVTTLLIKSGQLKTGDNVIANNASCKVKSMYNTVGDFIDIAKPSMVVEVVGISDIVGPRQKFVVVNDEKKSKLLCDNTAADIKDEFDLTADNLFSQIKQKELTIILKCDSNSTNNAIKNTLLSYSNTNKDIKVNIISDSVGTVSDSDLSFALTTNAKIIAFNSKVSASIKKKALSKNIDILYYSSMHDLFEHVKDLLNSMLELVVEEKNIGSAKVLQIFDIGKIGIVLGSSITSGIFKRKAKVKVFRGGEELFQSSIKDIKREKDSVDEVSKGLECGISLANISKEVKVGDVLECFEEHSKKADIF